jgi:hypothetical protein
MPMSPPIGGRNVPTGFQTVLKLVFQLDGSNPYKDDANNINEFDRFKPGGRFNETYYQTYMISLHSDMKVMDYYLAIKDMMQHMISSQHIRVSTQGRDMYSPSLLENLHQVTTPLARAPSDEMEEADETEYDFSTQGKVTRDTDT